MEGISNPSPDPAPSPAAASAPAPAPALDRDIELEKLKIEWAKLDVEKRKANWTGLTVMVPLVAAILTVALGLYTTYQTSKSTFQLEVAKSIMQAPNPDEANSRAKFYSALFPQRLPATFMQTGVEAASLGIGGSDANARRLFLKTMIEKDIDVRTLVALWKVLFPKDNDDFLSHPEIASVLAQIPLKPPK